MSAAARQRARRARLGASKMAFVDGLSNIHPAGLPPMMVRSRWQKRSMSPLRNAFIISRKELRAPAGPKPKNHDLVGLYEYAVKYGLKRNALVASNLPHISLLHQLHYARYPQEQAIPVTLIAQFDDLVDELFADVNEAVQPLIPMSPTAP